MAADLILLGVVGRPHGVRGLVHVQSYTEDPRALAAYGPLTDDAGREWTLAWRRDGIAELRDADGKTLTDRDAASRLTNLRLHIPRDRLPVPDNDEYYLGDLVGMQAVSASGDSLGSVVTVHDYGAGASLELSGGHLVPFTRACVPEVSVTARCLSVVLPVEVTAEADAPTLQADSSP